MCVSIVISYVYEGADELRYHNGIMYTSLKGEDIYSIYKYLIGKGNKMNKPNQITKATRDPNSKPTENQMYWVRKYLPNDHSKVLTTSQASMIIEAFSGRTLEK